jgi:hypothetical protein
MPLRGIALLSQGRVTLPMIDALVHTVNRRPDKGAWTILRALR